MMKTIRLFAFLCMLTLAVTGAPGDTIAEVSLPDPAPELSVRETEPLATGLMLNFRDASLDSILDYLSEQAGFIILKTVEVEGRITIISRQPLTVDEVVDLLNSALKDKGYAVVQTNRILRVVPLSDAPRTNVPVRSGIDLAAMGVSDRIFTQVIPLRYVEATRLRQDLEPLIPGYASISANAGSNTLILTDTEANIRRIAEIVLAIDTHLGTVAEIRVMHLQYASATNAVRLINEIFGDDTATRQQPTQAAAARAAAVRRFRTAEGADPGDSEAGRQAHKVTASADERTNTVVYSGPPELLAVVEQVLRELDDNPTAEQSVLHYPLRNAKAGNLATILNNLFAEMSTAQTGDRRTARDPRQQTAATAAQAADLTGQVRVVADEDSNSLMIMTTPRNFDQVSQIIAELDRPVPQVLIRAIIAEITRTDRSDLGIEFSALNLRSSGRGSAVFTDFGVEAATGGLLYRLVEEDVTVALRALEEVGKLDVLSRPYILTSDNQPATITIGHNVPFIRSTRITETGQTINTIEYEDIGIILQVTPHINHQGLVTLDVAPEISTLTGDQVTISDNVFAPVFAKRSASSRVAIQDGQTIVIGGLMEDRQTTTTRKVPILGSLPLVGGAFRRNQDETTKTELLIFLTPQVAMDSAELEKLSEERQ